MGPGVAQLLLLDVLLFNRMDREYGYASRSTFTGDVKMDLVNIVAWIILGAIAGWLASIVMRSPMGLVADIIVGIVGAFIGGFVLSLLPGVNAGVSGLNIASIITAFIGAVILLGLIRMMRRSGAV